MTPPTMRRRRSACRRRCHLLALDPATLLRRTDDGAHRRHRGLEQPFVRAVIIIVVGAASGCGST